MSLASLYGQGSASFMLRSILRSGRLGHAYMFVGPDGVGKSVFAREFAKAVLCEAPEDACDGCNVCLRVDSGNHPDVLELRPDGRFKIEHARAALRHVEYKPVEGGARIAIILHAESMTTDAANCLLKSMEDPPGPSLFILTTTSASSVLPTVASRCQTIPFGACSRDEVAAYLNSRHPGDNERCGAAAFWSGGIPGRGDLFFEEGFLSTREKALRILTTIRELDAVGFAGAIDKEEAPLLLECLSSLLRDILVLGTGGPQELLGNPDLGPAIQKALGVWKPGGCAGGMAELERAYGAMAANTNRRQTLDVLLVKLQALIEDGYN